MLTEFTKHLSGGAGFFPSSLSLSPMNNKKQKGVRQSARTSDIPPMLGEERLSW